MRSQNSPPEITSPSLGQIMYTFAPGGDGVAPAQAAEAASKLTATLGSSLFTVTTYSPFTLNISNHGGHLQQQKRSR
jgi:hypothetical protein